MKALAFFGAFNPPTMGHVVAAETAMKKVKASFVFFVPSRLDYILSEQKKDFAYTDEERLNMLDKLIYERPWMRVCDYDIMSTGKHPYTYNTLCKIAAEIGTKPSLLIGSDKLFELNTWYRIQDIASDFGIVCAMRSGDDKRFLAHLYEPRLREIWNEIVFVEMPHETQFVSSSEVRSCVADMNSLKRELLLMVPPEILQQVVSKEV